MMRVLTGKEIAHIQQTHNFTETELADVLNFMQNDVHLFIEEVYTLVEHENLLLALMYHYPDLVKEVQAYLQDPNAPSLLDIPPKTQRTKT